MKDCFFKFGVNIICLGGLTNEVNAPPKANVMSREVAESRQVGTNLADNGLFSRGGGTGRRAGLKHPSALRG